MEIFSQKIFHICIFLALGRNSFSFENGTAVPNMTWFLCRLIPHERSAGCILRASHLWGTADIALESLRNYVTFSALLHPLWKEIPEVIGIWWNNAWKLCLFMLPQPYLYFICLGCSPPHNEKYSNHFDSKFYFPHHS